MKKIFIYYSNTGNGVEVATHLGALGYDIRKVVRKKKMPSSFFLCMMSGGFSAGIKKKDKLVDFNEDIEAYDEVAIGSPIWNGRFSCPINTVLSKLKLDGKKVKFIFYAGSGEGAKALERVKKEYPNADCLFLKEPKKYPEELNKLDSFCAK